MASGGMYKWIDGVSLEDRTSDVARQTLESRLAAVEHYLRLAARNAEEDVEYVHELRVWSRRAAAALALYVELLPRRRFAWMAKQLKRLRRAANDARDLDVLAQRLAQEHAASEVLADVRRPRAAAQRPIVAIYKRLRRSDRFGRRIQKLLRRVRPRVKQGDAFEEPRFGDWARKRFRPIAENFFAAMPADWKDEAAVHQFRIRGKELRYAMELLAGAFPTAFRDELYPIVKTLQDQLGEINDCATAQSRLRQRIETTSDRVAVEGLEKLLADEETRLGQAQGAFLEWCTTQRLEGLRAQYACMLAGSVPNCQASKGQQSLLKHRASMRS